MKKTIFALATFALFAFNFSVNAQVDVTASPLSLIILQDINAGADIGLSENFSVDIRAGFRNTDMTLSNYGFAVQAIPVTVTGKYYFNPKRGADGFSAELFVKNAYRDLTAQADSDAADFTWNRGGIGFGFGYKVVSQKGFVFDIGFGLGKKIYDNAIYDTNTGTERVKLPTGFLPLTSGRVAIGYRFGGTQKHKR